MPHRKSVKGNDSKWALTLRTSRREFICFAAFNVMTALATIFSVFGFVFLFPNDYKLPMNVFILCLPVETNFLNWIINYAYQLIVLIFALFHFVSYFPTFLILMNHSCWYVDMLISDIKKWNSHLYECVEPTTSRNCENIGIVPRLNSVSDEKKFKEHLRSVVEMGCNIIKWRNDVNSLLSFIFCVEFTSVSAILSLCAFTFHSNTSHFAFHVTFFICLELFCNCWLGSKNQSKFEELSMAIYDMDWYLMTPKQRKDLCLVLTMTQNMKTFDGIFFPVDFKTFQKVLKLNDYLIMFIFIFIILNRFWTCRTHFLGFYKPYIKEHVSNNYCQFKFERFFVQCIRISVKIITCEVWKLHKIANINIKMHLEVFQWTFLKTPNKVIKNLAIFFFVSTSISHWLWLAKM